MSRSPYTSSPHNQTSQPPPQPPPPLQPSFPTQVFGCGARAVLEEQHAKDVHPPLHDTTEEIRNISQNNSSCLLGNVGILEQGPQLPDANIPESLPRSSCVIEAREPQDYETLRPRYIRENESLDTDLSGQPLRSSCLLGHNIPSIINLNQASPRPHDDDIYPRSPENAENRTPISNTSQTTTHSTSDIPEDYNMYPGTQHPYYAPYFHQTYQNHPYIFRPTVIKPDNNRLLYPMPWSRFFRYPGYPPYSNLMMHNRVYPLPPKEENEVITVPSDDEENEDPIIDVEENVGVPDLTAKVEATEEQKLEKVRPVGKVMRRPRPKKAANQKCNKCDDIFVKGPELFCHISKVHKKDKTHACKHCGYCCLQVKRARTVSKSSSTSTTSVKTPSPDRSPKSEPSSQRLEDGQPTEADNLPSTSNKKRSIKVWKKKPGRKQKTDLHLPSPKTLQNSLNKIF